MSVSVKIKAAQDKGVTFFCVWGRWIEGEPYTLFGVHLNKAEAQSQARSVEDDLTALHGELYRSLLRLPDPEAGIAIAYSAEPEKRAVAA